MGHFAIFTEIQIKTSSWINDIQWWFYDTCIHFLQKLPKNYIQKSYQKRQKGKSGASFEPNCLRFQR